MACRRDPLSSAYLVILLPMGPSALLPRSTQTMWLQQQHGPQTPGGPLSPSCPPGDALAGAFTYWSTRPWVLAATWSKSCGQPEISNSHEQAKLPEWGLWPLSSHLWAPEDCNSNWSRDPRGWLCPGLAEKTGVETGVRPAPRPRSTTVRGHQRLPRQCGCGGNRKLNPHFWVQLHLRSYPFIPSKFFK